MEIAAPKKKTKSNSTLCKNRNTETNEDEEERKKEGSGSQVEDVASHILFWCSEEIKETQKNIFVYIPQIKPMLYRIML